MYSRFPILHKASVLYTRLFSSTWTFKRVDELKVLGNGFFGHPEVKLVSLVMLLYAGKASIFSFKYSLFIDTVKKLKQ